MHLNTGPHEAPLLLLRHLPCTTFIYQIPAQMAAKVCTAPHLAAAPLNCCLPVAAQPWEAYIAPESCETRPDGAAVGSLSFNV